MFSVAYKNAGHGGLVLPWLFWLVAIPVIAYIVFGDAPEGLVLDRQALAQGEYWRLITGHWVHSDIEHAIWNVLAMALLVHLTARDAWWAFLGAFLLAMFSINVWFLAINSTLLFYCGLSGILNAAFVIALESLWRQTGSRLVWLIGLAAVAKMLFELTLGYSLFTQTAWQSVPQAHVIGFLSGLGMLGLRRLLVNR